MGIIGSMGILALFLNCQFTYIPRLWNTFGGTFGTVIPISQRISCRIQPYSHNTVQGKWRHQSRSGSDKIIPSFSCASSGSIWSTFSQAQWLVLALF